MGRDLRGKGIRGVEPVLFVFLARTGAEVLEATYFEVDAAGQSPRQGDRREVRPGVPGVRIRFQFAGRPVQEMSYVSVDVLDDKLGKDSGFLAWAGRFGPANGFLKAASFILHDNAFSRTRSFLLATCEAILQDDSGVPYRLLQEGRRLGAHLLRPLPAAARSRSRATSRRDLDEACKAQPARPLDFIIGYRRQVDSSLQLYVKGGAQSGRRRAAPGRRLPPLHAGPAPTSRTLHPAPRLAERHHVRPPRPPRTPPALGLLPRALAASPAAPSRRRPPRPGWPTQGRALGCQVERDAVGNVLIRKPASPGRERRPPVALQGHVDMVCEKNEGTPHDFAKDPIASAATATCSAPPAPPWAPTTASAWRPAWPCWRPRTCRTARSSCCVTIDEETGLTGANGLAGRLAPAATLLNLDSEEEGELTIGCAGGMDTVVAPPALHRRAARRAPRRSGSRSPG